MYCLRCGYKNDDHATVCKNCNSNMKEMQDRYNFDTNSCKDQQDYRYKYSYGTNPPSTTTNTCEDQQDYRYKYSYGTNPPKINNNTSDNQYNYSERYSLAETSDTVAGDEKYFQAYIGPRYNQVIRQKFSFATLLLGPLQFFSRGMFLYSLLWTFALIVVNYYYPNYFKLIFYLTNLFMAFKYKTIYLDFVDKQIEKIKLQSLDLTTQEIIDKCKTKGGHKLEEQVYDKKFILRLTIIMMIATIIIPVAANIVSQIERDEYTPPFVNNEELSLQYEISNEFQRIYKTEFKESYVYINNGDSCNIDIVKYLNTNNYYTDKEFFESKTNIPETAYYDETEMINGNIWTTLEFEGKRYYYIRLKNNTAYIITTEIIFDLYGDCKILIDNFINSLKIA